MNVTGPHQQTSPALSSPIVILHMCHPERSEGTHPRAEMLRCTQHDNALPNCGA